MLDDQVLGVLEEGYLRNREAFPDIDCRFDYAGGKAATAEEALAGRFIQKEVMNRGRWLVNGPNVLYELLCTPEKTEQTERIKKETAERDKKDLDSGKQLPDKSVVWVPCVDTLYLRNVSYSLRYGPSTLAATLFNKTDNDGAGIRITPFNLDFLGPDEYSSPASYFRDARARQWPANFDGTKRINGVDTLIARVGPSLEATFGFDPARGYLLVYFSYMNAESGNAYLEAYVTEARECSGDRWFPMRTVVIDNPGSSPPFNVKEVTVLELDVDAEPHADRFRLELPAGVHVVKAGGSEAAGYDWEEIRHRETMRIDDLAALDKRCVEHGRRYRDQERKLFDTDGETLGRSGSRSVLVIITLLLAVAVVWLIVRNRRH